MKKIKLKKNEINDNEKKRFLTLIFFVMLITKINKIKTQKNNKEILNLLLELLL